jgi:hypothetical protein
MIGLGVYLESGSRSYLLDNLQRGKNTSESGPSKEMNQKEAGSTKPYATPVKNETDTRALWKILFWKGKAPNHCTDDTM